MARRLVSLVVPLALGGCSLIDPIDADDYTSGGVGGASGATTTGATTSTTSASTTSSSTGAGGGGGEAPVRTDGTCPMSGDQTVASFRDDFEDPARGSGWQPPFASGCVEETGGEVAIGDLIGTFCKYESMCGGLVLRNSSVSVRVVELAAAPPAQTALYLTERGTGRKLALIAISELITVRDVEAEPNPIHLEGIAFQAPGWWRLRGVGEEVEVSTHDGDAWTVHGTVTPPFSLDAPLSIELVGGAGTGRRARGSTI